MQCHAINDDVGDNREKSFYPDLENQVIKSFLLRHFY